MKTLDVVIVGAGPAGIGMAMELGKVPGLEFEVLDSGKIGESFRHWPKQTRFITPSFYSNPFGLTDLNAVDANTSPATFAGRQHLSGNQYADYLTSVANSAQLPVVCDCKVLEVNPDPDGGFHIVTEHGERFSQFVIWATGEFQFPDLNPFPGGEYCLHYAHIKDWNTLATGTYVVIGGYESGLDSAINLLNVGHKVELLIRRSTWEKTDINDPSQVLSPYTRERLDEVKSNDHLTVSYGANVVEVAEDENCNFIVHASDGRNWTVSNLPILGTGFLKGGGACQIRELWDWNEDGHITLSNDDESLLTPGLFLVGPQVRHDERIYCFIYKFRQRFARIAREISQRLELEIEWLEGSEDGIWGPFGNSECCEGCEC